MASPAATPQVVTLPTARVWGVAKGAAYSGRDAARRLAGLAAAPNPDALAGAVAPPRDGRPIAVFPVAPTAKAARPAPRQAGEEGAT